MKKLFLWLTREPPHRCADCIHYLIEDSWLKRARRWLEHGTDTGRDEAEWCLENAVKFAKCKADKRGGNYGYFTARITRECQIVEKWCNKFRKKK
jgi:hypothetical protein